MDTRPDDLLEPQRWTSFSELGLAIGKATTIQNVSRNGDALLRVWIGPTKPAADFLGGRRVVVNALAEIAAGEKEIHLFAEKQPVHVNIEVAP